MRARALLSTLLTLFALLESGRAHAQADVVINVMETVTVSDTVQVLPPAVIVVDEAITVSDAVQVLPPAVLSIIETITVSDAVKVLPPAVILVDETVTVADIVVLVPPAVITVAETITVSDMVVPDILPAPPMGMVEEEAKVGADDGADGDKLGSDVALSGKTGVLGAPFHDSSTDTGSAYVIVRADDGWSQQGRLAAVDAADGDNFGISVDIDGDTVVVGAENDDALATDSGSAYVFIRSGTTWALQDKLTAGVDGGAFDYFGSAVAISGDAIVVGARSTDISGVASNVGSAYVFVRNGGTWDLQAKLGASDSTGSSGFGESVAIDGDTVVVAARVHGHDVGQGGSVYFFVRSGTTWTEQAELRAGDAQSGDRLGNAVAISGDTVVAGAALSDTAGVGSSVGSAYVFVRSGTTWAEQSKLLASDAGGGDNFGADVAISRHTIVVGATRDDDSGLDSGAVYVFVRDGTTWTEQQKVKAGDPGTQDEFGGAVAISGSTLLAGARLDDDLGASSGSAYVFAVPQADVAVVKAGSPDPVKAGEELVYTITVVNNGPITSTAVVVTDTLPAQVTFVSASTGCSESAGTVTCDLGDLPSGASVTLTVTVGVTITAAGTLSNTVAVSASEADPNLSNNSHAAVTAVIAADPPDFDVPPTPLLGTTFTVNAGESLQFNVQVSDVDVQANVTQITAGTDHTCALLDTGVVRCWGWASVGQLGYGNINRIGDDETPATAGDVDVGGTVAQIVAGHAHTCAVLDTGAVRCWGYGGFSILGYGNTDTIGDDETPASAGDVDVGGTVTQITAGKHHTCALLDTPAVCCWGYGSGGRLGYGNTDTIGDGETPATAGDVDVGGTVVQIVAGQDHTCALLDTGAVRCWGLGANGRLGYGNTNDIGDDESPATAGDVDVGGAVVQIDAGLFHTCAVLDTGAVRCWGAGGTGRLGYGNSVTIGDDETPETAGDVDVGGTVAQIVTGTHTCALLDTGAVHCWGSGTDGKLGYGNTTIIGDNETPASAGDVDIVDPGDVVTLDVADLPAGAVFAPGTPANPVSAIFTWVPTGADVGSYAVTFTAQDSTGLSATPHIINIEVKQPKAVPGVTPLAVAALAGAFVLLLAWGLRRRATAFARYP